MINKTNKLILIGFIFLGLGCQMPWDSSDSPKPVIHIIPQINNIAVSDKLSLEIRTSNVSNLFGTNMHLLYDPKILKFDTAIEGTFLNQNNMDSTVFLYSNNTTHGKILVGLSRIGFIGGISGSGLLATIHFEAINKGVSSVNFDSSVATKSTNNDPVPELTPIIFIGSSVKIE